MDSDVQTTAVSCLTRCITSLHWCSYESLMAWTVSHYMTNSQVPAQWYNYLCWHSHITKSTNKQIITCFCCYKYQLINGILEDCYKNKKAMSHLRLRCHTEYQHGCDTVNTGPAAFNLWAHHSCAAFSAKELPFMWQA